jgi:membrane-bound lytic murein transglycosylase D
VEAIEGASDRIRFQLGQKQRFKQGLERSYMYLDTISSILKKYGLPDQLKYLPHVESSFDPKPTPGWVLRVFGSSCAVPESFL